jgi:sarcosine oxidase gamma subunit
VTDSPVESVDTPDRRPILRVVKGDLTPEELAALVTVVAARNAAAAHAAARTKPAPRSQWGHPAQLARKPHRFGPDQWRRSAFGG